MRKLPLILALALLPGTGLPAMAEEPGEDELILQAARIGTEGTDLLDFFRRRTLPPDSRARLEGLVRQLGDETFVVREAAWTELIAIGSPAIPYLDRGRYSDDLEVTRRSEDCLRHIAAGGVGPNVPIAAVRLLTQHRPAGTVEVLLNYLPYCESAGLADEIHAAFANLALRGGAHVRPLQAALADPDPARRTAAAVALCRAGDREPAAVRKLLLDPDSSVRLHVALALAATKEKEALPVLIDLLPQLPPGPAWLAEDVLLRLADGKGPVRRDGWAAWWRANAAQADLGRLTATPPFLGYTLVLTLTQGRIQELGVDGKPRLQIDGLQFPLDAQWLPGDRILTAEHGSNRVTERDRRGKIHWQKLVEYPLAAQRLANGNTFIATRTLFLEVDRDGNELTGFPPPENEPIMKAQKLPNGDIACVTAGPIQKFYLLGPTGKERRSYPVSMQTSGGRIDVLPNGHVLVPQMEANKVAEYDPAGKVVWTADAEQPVAAVRLANGHTLVTSMTLRRAVELDRDGKEVWGFKADTLVNRAWRR